MIKAKKRPRKIDFKALLKINLTFIYAKRGLV